MTATDLASSRARCSGAWALGVLLMGLVVAPAVAADSPAKDRFRLITAERPSTLERKLKAAGAEGYSLVMASRGTSLNGKGRGVVLLERDPDNPTPTEFELITTSGDLAAAAADASVETDKGGNTEFRKLTAAGYRLRMRGVLGDNPDDWWVPESGYQSQVWLILERRGTRGPYTYDTFAFSTAGSFEDEMASRTADGFHVLGILNSARRLRILLERAPAAEKDSAPTSAGPRYQMLMGSRKLGVRLQLNDASAKGYRLAGIADASTIAPPIVLVERNARRIGEHVYRTLYEPGTKIYKDKLDRKLNKRARKGLRVVPGGITSTVVVFEQSQQRVAYRTLSSRSRPALTEQLAAAVGQGQRIMALFVNGDETTVVLERDSLPS